MNHSQQFMILMSSILSDSIPGPLDQLAFAWNPDTQTEDPFGFVNSKAFHSLCCPSRKQNETKLNISLPHWRSFPFRIPQEFEICIWVLALGDTKKDPKNVLQGLYSLMGDKDNNTNV